MSTIKVTNIQSPDSGTNDIIIDANGNVTVDPLYVDATNNRVGIGTTSPGSYNSSFDDLVVATSGETGITIATGTSSNGTLAFADGTTGDQTYRGFVQYSHTNDALVFGTAGTDRGRFDSSGRLLVGTSSSPSAGAGQYAKMFSAGNTLSATGDGRLALARGNTAANLSSGNGIGELLYTDSTGGTFASIGALVDAAPGTNDYPGRLVFSTTADGASSPTERMRIKSDGVLVKYGDSGSARIIPQTDNAGYIGQSTHRWEAIYAVNGTIQTSDEREKTEIRTSQLGSEFIRSLRPVSYKWKIGGYTSSWDNEGKEIITPNPGVRTHYGFIAQEVKQACGNADFGGWLQEDLSDPESMQSLRLHEFISPIVKALQEALDEIDTLKAKVAALEAA